MIMGKHGYGQCKTQKCKTQKCRPKKKGRGLENKVALMMVLLGIMAIFALCLPLKYWVMLLSMALVAFGIVLLKS